MASVTFVKEKSKKKKKKKGHHSILPILKAACPLAGHGRGYKKGEGLVRGRGKRTILFNKYFNKNSSAHDTKKSINII